MNAELNGVKRGVLSVVDRGMSLGMPELGRIEVERYARHFAADKGFELKSFGINNETHGCQLFLKGSQTEAQLHTVCESIALVSGLRVDATALIPSSESGKNVEQRVASAPLNSVDISMPVTNFAQLHSGVGPEVLGIRQLEKLPQQVVREMAAASPWLSDLLVMPMKEVGVEVNNHKIRIANILAGDKKEFEVVVQPGEKDFSITVNAKPTIIENPLFVSRLRALDAFLGERHLTASVEIKPSQALINEMTLEALPAICHMIAEALPATAKVVEAVYRGGNTIELRHFTAMEFNSETFAALAKIKEIKGFELKARNFRQIDLQTLSEKDVRFLITKESEGARVYGPLPKLPSEMPTTAKEAIETIVQRIFAEGLRLNV